MAFNYGENDHLVYPNLVSAHIKTANVLAPSTASLPSQPPPASSLLKRVEDMPAYRKPSLEPYKFEAEKEVLTRAANRADIKDSPSSEGVELDLCGGVVDKVCGKTC